MRMPLVSKFLCPSCFLKTEHIALSEMIIPILFASTEPFKILDTPWFSKE